jgi:hypothetical protein
MANFNLNETGFSAGSANGSAMYFLSSVGSIKLHRSISTLTKANDT